ncbi:SRPBCC family protein [Amycolatopsis echigonensis]|uniref:Polyketide cyclase/dehydrase/lipid transport protein n=1 Tax=Amycolatopsis echigonensis TaxID=2576905 RepID=A0A2N3WUH9_9PSEU|nr:MULTISPECIES: SRPBCC family protein [Amycolatopsis]MBB2497762.1 SRPBCC family protein [Amycolatopsis echigonensis]PKV97536.1 polyketide cyclase/dehydrase/lipid transport protein [Amycolatopsis niigatensis]
MAAAAHYVEVNAPAQACYDWWRPLTRLPELFSDVRSVEAVDQDGTRTRWKVDGPAGSTVEWEARIVEDAPPRKIAWTTVDDADPDVRNSGVVRFEDKGHGRTGVEISLEYRPPAGKLGEAVASLLADPQKKVERAAEQFQTVIEAR